MNRLVSGALQIPQAGSSIGMADMWRAINISRVAEDRTWSISATATASRLLSLVSLLRVFLNFAGKPCFRINCQVVFDNAGRLTSRSWRIDHLLCHILARKDWRAISTTFLVVPSKILVRFDIIHDDNYACERDTSSLRRPLTY